MLCGAWVRVKVEEVSSYSEEVYKSQNGVLFQPRSQQLLLCVKGPRVPSPTPNYPSESTTADDTRNDTTHLGMCSY